MNRPKFYVAKKSYEIVGLTAGYSWASGAFIPASDRVAGTDRIQLHDSDMIKYDTTYEGVNSVTYYWFNRDRSLIKTDANRPQGFSALAPAGASSFAIDFNFSSAIEDTLESLSIYRGQRVHPFYKTMSKSYKRENEQMFFRESLSDSIRLIHEKDFSLIRDASINDTLVLEAYKGNNTIIAAEFNKTDCTLDYARKRAEIKLTQNDKYTNVLAHYGDEYDLIKCAPPVSRLTFTKRCIVQIYIAGENVISNYSGGTYWETEVNTAVDSEDELQKKYYFYPGPVFKEVNLSGFNYDINASYKCEPNSRIWNGASFRMVDGKPYKIPCSIVFTKKYNSGEDVPAYDRNIFCISDGISSGIDENEELMTAKALFDTYRIEIYDGDNGTGELLYHSDYLYGLDKGIFELAQSENLYPMSRVAQPAPLKQPLPETFALGNLIVEYKTWVRELCDVEALSDGTPTYDLPYDDFATERSNYKRCIGLSGVNGPNSVIQIKQEIAKSETPTAYGKNDYGLYFTSPFTGFGQHGFLPLARSSWANTSLWVYLDNAYEEGSFEAWCSQTYKQYAVKDNYHIADVIKALLASIDPSLKHEATPEFSKFLYGSQPVVSSNRLANCQLYITPKSNILKGEYDQAAQQAKISLESVMTMLRECFKCYWYIDDNNRFIIEHIYYFMHGYSYTDDMTAIDLVSSKDKFNQKPVLYCQKEIQYQKSNLKSRVEFAWADSVTDAMGNLPINFDGAFMPKDSTSSITISDFCPDIDYMLFKPDNFSNDGFAIVLARDSKVPIVTRTIYDPKQFGAPLQLYTQNGFMSWRQLIYHRMYDAPSNTLRLGENEGPNIWRVINTERIMRHEIEVIPDITTMNLDITKLVTTDFGNGFIEEAEVDIVTEKTRLVLSYEPD